MSMCRIVAVESYDGAGRHLPVAPVLLAHVRILRTGHRRRSAASRTIPVRIAE